MADLFRVNPPQDVIPTASLFPDHVDVRLRLEFDKEGEEVIYGWMELDCTVKVPQSFLTLHQNGLFFSKCEYSTSKSWNECVGWDTDVAGQKVTFRFAQPLAVGPVRFHLAWTVRVDALPVPNNGQGWVGLYIDHDGPDSYHAITQFEPCNARMIYPCWDQPSTKFTLRLSLSNVPAALKTLSNTDIESEKEEENGRKSVVFKKTLPIPAYLSAFVIGRFASSEKVLSLPDFESKGSRDVSVRVHIPPNYGDGEYALALSCSALEFFSRSFQVNYPYSKLDGVATALHPLLGMENWGLITYKAGYFDVSKKATTDRKKRIARLVGHEVLHQWFGNSTSVAWWSFLYLKEGFARLLEYVFVDHLHPEWKYWDHFQSDIYQQVLELDERANTHPIERRIDHPPEIYANVDTICYGKGASVLRQLWSFVGKETFFKSLELYLNRHKNECATPDMLWRAISDISRLDIEALMGPWVRFSGHPYVHASRHPSGGIQLEQRLCGEAVADAVPKDSEGRTLFPIPMLCRVGPNETRRFIFDTGKQTLQDYDFVPFVLLNANSCGFYRVCYADALLRELTKNMGDLKEVEICTVALDSLYFFSRGTGDISADSLVAFLAKCLESIRSHYLWQILLPKVSLLMSDLDLTSAFRHVAAALRPHVIAFYNNVGSGSSEFVERGHFGLLEVLLTQVCSSTDPWSVSLGQSAEDALFQLGQKEPIKDKATIFALLNPIALWCQSVNSEAACEHVLQAIQDEDFHGWSKGFLENLLWQSSSDKHVRQLLSTVGPESFGKALEMSRGRRRVAVAILAESQKTEIDPEISKLAKARSEVGETVRNAFLGFEFRPPQFLKERTRTISFGKTSEKQKGYFDWKAYAALGLVVFGGICLIGFVANKTIRK